MELQDKVAVVTGASRGIGAATARLLANEGCRVAVNYRQSKEEADAVVNDIGDHAFVLAGDVAKDADCRSMIATTIEKCGRLDILVNNAGTTSFIDFPDLEAVTDEVWDQILGTNVKGIFQCARAAAPHLRAHGEGVIINVASVAGLVGAGSSIPYCASKAAAINLTTSLARTLCPEIRVNAVAPGVIDGEWLKRGLGDDFSDVMDTKAEQALLKKVSKPEDIAQAILGLIRADLVTGQTLPVDAGAMCGPAMNQGYRW
ncbi:MAG: SDR family NAD(P)-dependent oxidoreductase [Limisphaerales bacterium]